jgi:hypothetical protein
MAVVRQVYDLRGRKRQLARKAVHVLTQLESDLHRGGTYTVIQPTDDTAQVAPLLAVIKKYLTDKHPVG